MDLNELQQKINNYITVVSSWVRNVGKLYFSGTPENVTVDMIDDNGNLTTSTLPNVAQFRKTVWDDVGGAIGQWNKTFYLDEVNGDDLNSGSELSPFKTIKKAVNSVPTGGTAAIRFLSDMTFKEVVYTRNTYISFELRGHKLILTDRTVNDKQLLNNFYCSNSIIEVRGDTTTDSSIVLPENTTDNGLDYYTKSWITSSGGWNSKANELHLSYTPNIIDSGDYVLISAANSNCKLSVQNYTIDSSADRNIKDLVMGVVLDDNGVPRNLVSNIVF